MSIQQVSAYRVGEQVFPTIQEAQKSELLSLMNGGKDSPSNAIAVDWMVSHVDEVVAILTCQPRTKKPRSDKGKKRAPKTPAATAT